MAARRLAPRLVAAAGAAALCLGVAACGGGGSDEERITAGLIVKQETNPFFVTMRETAQQAAEESNVNLLTAAGKSDVDNKSQVTALEYMTARGAKGILITPADSKAIVPAIEKARDAGVIVIALDSPTEPPSAVDALLATDNRRAGELIGRYAKAKAEQEGMEPKIAMLDLAPGVALGELRHDGFLDGFGIEDGDPQIVGEVDTEGNTAKAKAGMEKLLAKEPGINVVYTINEPAGFGAATALEAAGKGEDDVILVSIDGGCAALKSGIRPEVIDATAQQYPENMASEGVEAIATAVRGGVKPSGYVDTGVQLITANPVEGVASKDEGWGTRNCWGG
jgi:fructose transport system substrate-binding protein